VLIFPSRQCSNTPVGFGKQFLSKDYMTTLEHPHQAAANFYLFPRLKSALKGQRFCNAIENIICVVRMLLFVLFGCYYLCCSDVIICVVWMLLFVLFYVVFVCKCVLPPGDNPIAVNK
jgi:hypothetical protein